MRTAATRHQPWISATLVYAGVAVIVFSLVGPAAAHRFLPNDTVATAISTWLERGSILGFLLVAGGWALGWKARASEDEALLDEKARKEPDTPA
jgi:hypothetical protein